MARRTTSKAIRTERGGGVAASLSRAIERFLFLRVELWIVCGLLLIGSLLAIGLAAAALDAERRGSGLSPISRAALAIAEMPRAAKRIVIGNRDMRVWESDRFKSIPSGWSFPSGPIKGLDGYILLSRTDGTEMRQKVELVALPSMRVVHSWTPLPADLLNGVTRVSRFAEYTNWTNPRFREVHPWLADNGDLIIKGFNSPLFRVDACSKRLWTLQGVPFHHSTEEDASGNLWIPSLAERPTVPQVTDAFEEDMITQVSPSGKLRFARSVPQMLIRHGFANWLFSNGMYNRDPTHLNDIQPVMSDGPYWKKGDLFISLRNVSAIMLYRPSTDEILWMKRGPWTSQHDVDVIDDHRIAVFDNAVQERSRQKPFFPTSSQIVVYDFASGRFSLPLKSAMERNNIKAWVEGLFTILPEGSMMVEDSASGHLMVFRRNGSIAAEYLNRAKDDAVYHLSWSRYIDKTKGDLVLRNLQTAKCLRP